MLVRKDNAQFQYFEGLINTKLLHINPLNNKKAFLINSRRLQNDCIVLK